MVIDLDIKRMVLRAPGCHYATCIELNTLVSDSMYLSSEHIGKLQGALECKKFVTPAHLWIVILTGHFA
jgi:hypothetical protein